uniref:Uncharacterized protein n=1 Tax=Picea sitchensis TaxID=3332 RepID=B8LPF7_PICSI|nr:unknown [Picea sitchensis]
MREVTTSIACSGVGFVEPDIGIHRREIDSASTMTLSLYLSGSVM